MSIEEKSIYSLVLSTYLAGFKMCRLFKIIGIKVLITDYFEHIFCNIEWEHRLCMKMQGTFHDLTFTSSLLQKIELRSFVPRDYSRQRTGKMAESRMGDEEA